ncbi:MAG TPA: histidinol dehydrogenase [Terriglobia bacterium]|nr:histidinol dehydrogenase [Terriglobia bacterium]
MLRIIRSTDKPRIARLLETRRAQLEQAEVVARRILEDVRRNGDAALVRLTRRFEKIDLRKVGFTVSEAEIQEACDQASPDFKRAIGLAAKNIRATARRQLPRPWRASNGAGVEVSQIVRPLDRVACYVPGGRFPLPSTVLMSVIPAQVVGVREVVVTSPRPAPAVLVAAHLLGMNKVFRLGGAQAIAAFAYGTESVPAADKIVGPGNRYVAAAKKLVAGECGIDFVAGPSELVVVGSRGHAAWIAADLVAQAEHDPDAVAIFITSSAELARKVQAAVGEILVKEFRRSLPVAEQSIAGQGAIILTRDLGESVDLVNRLAPEHLTLLDDAAEALDRIHSAGSIFLGSYSAVAAGDYASGPNHILPTGGAARLSGGLSAADFVKRISVQRLSRAGLARLRGAIVTLAKSEGLKAHAYSVETRFRRIDD